jgi:hypothetical protein
MDRALGDKDPETRKKAVRSPAFGPQHVERALGDEFYGVRMAARERVLEFVNKK